MTLRPRSSIRRLTAALGAVALLSVGAHVAATAPPEPALTTTEIGRSVNGMPITVMHRSDHQPESDAWTVLVIGVIHGDEQGGLPIVDLLRSSPLPTDVDLYLIDTMNPDGVAADQRGNANGVDLNRNFPYDWQALESPGHWQYAGTSPASEPETQAIVAYIESLRPDMVVWYHQDANSIAGGEGRAGAIRQRYAELTGLPIAEVLGGTYTGIAAIWARHELESNERAPGVAFIVELDGDVSPEEATTHAAAVLTVATELL